MSAQQGQTEDAEKKLAPSVEPANIGETGEEADSSSQHESDSQQENTAAVAGKSAYDMTDFVTFWASVEAGFARGALLT